MYISPSLEYKHISEWLIAMVNKPTTPRKFARKLSRYLNTHQHPVRVNVVLEQNDLLKPGQFSFSGEYDPGLDETGRKQFILHFITTTNKNDPWVLEQDESIEMALELTEVLVHEYEHQRQYRKRGYKTHRCQYKSDHSDYTLRREQEYLGDPDEINAYAMNIAARFYLLRHVLNTTSKYTCFDLKRYLVLFGYKHEVTKILIHKIKHNIDYFKENDNGKTQRRANRRS